MKNPRYTQMSVRVHNEMIERLDRIAQENSMTRSAVINYAVGQFLRKEEYGYYYTQEPLPKKAVGAE